MCDFLSSECDRYQKSSNTIAPTSSFRSCFVFVPALVCTELDYLHLFPLTPTCGIGLSQGGGGWWVLVKGSPEAIGERLAEGQRPAGYDDRAASLAKGGMRVLALAYKRPRSDTEGAACEESRAVAEKDLCFAGFVAFSCRVRKDTRKVILQLREGAHDVAMVTGDAILTAVHVAIEVRGGDGGFFAGSRQQTTTRLGIALKNV